jgi:hypothetical protein
MNRTLKLISLSLLSTMAMAEPFVQPSHNGAQASQSNVAGHSTATEMPINGGVIFKCKPHELKKIEKEMSNYLAELEFPVSALKMTKAKDGKSITYNLNTPPEDSDTLTLAQRPELDILPEILSYTRHDGKVIRGEVTSRKEILAALMQHGREYVLTGKRCSVEHLKDHVGVRQSIVKWGKFSLMRWDFPEEWTKEGKLESKYAEMNPVVWGARKDDFIPKGVKPHEAIDDAFTGKFKYSIGCTTAAKLIMVQGIMDYYRNVKKDQKMVDYLNARANRAPLSEIDVDEDDPARAKHGKYLSRQYNVPGNNLIPGDWIYIKNLHEDSSNQTGYEGSNTIYMGGDLMTNFYFQTPGALHGSPYFLHEPREVNLNHKLLEVWNWRKYVREDYENNPNRDFLTHDQVLALRKTPKQGGLLLDSRDSWADLLPGDK